MILGTVRVRSLLKATSNSDGVSWLAPQHPYPSLSDWSSERSLSSYDDIYNAFHEEIASRDAVFAMQIKYSEFDMVLNRLSMEASNENFWKGI
jgi:hypothetical protein